MNIDTIRQQLPSLVSAFVPRNARGFKFRIIDSLPQQSSLGFRIDPEPFDGKVVAVTDDAFIVKTGRIQFAVVSREMATETPKIGMKVHITPYARRRFDGLRADTPEEKIEYRPDGSSYITRTHILGSAPTPLPVPTPQCLELKEMIYQLENLPAPDGFRKISHLLVDAGARDFTCVDPTPKNIIKTPPAITFTVDTSKFQGKVTILYDRGGDLYVIELRRDDALIEHVGDLFFDDLGEVLERLIDDGRWRQIQVQRTGESKPTRH